MEWILVLYLIMNIVAFVFYGVDKSRAKKGAWRISEVALLGLAAFGGLGAFLGMQVFRHKTKHPKFYIGVPLLAVLQVGLLLFLCVKFFFV